MRKAFRAIVSGRVQMVMYRDFTQRSARSLGIVGTVKNLDDGGVEVVAEGEESALNAFLEKLQRGSMLSRIEKVDVTWQSPTQLFADFRVA